MISHLSKNYIALNLGCEAREKIKRYRLCSKHPKEPLRLFCENCEVLFCPMCIVEHSGHTFIEQKFSTESIRKKIALLKSKLLDKIKYLKTMKHRIDDELRVLGQDSTEEKKKLDEFMGNLLDSIKKKVQELSQYMDGKLNTEKTNIVKIVERLDGMQEDLKNQAKNIAILDKHLAENSDNTNDPVIRQLFESVNQKHSAYFNSKTKGSGSLKTNMYRSSLQKDLLVADIGCISKSDIISQARADICSFRREPQGAYLQSLERNMGVP